MKKWFNWKKPFIYIVTLIVALLSFLLYVWVEAKNTMPDRNQLYARKNIDISATGGAVKVNIPTATADPIQIWKEDEHGNRIDDFKILSTSDIHFQPNGDEFALDVLSEYIDREHPDLVVLCGDNIFATTDTKYAHDIVNFFEKKQQYWTFVLGNHDSEGWKDQGMDLWQAREIIFNAECGIEQFGETAPHCLARSIIDDTPEHYGQGTNRIDIIGSQGRLQTILTYDCLAIDNPNPTICQWTTDQIQDAQSNILVFSHKPMYEMKQYYYQIGQDPNVKYEWGLVQEPICVDGTSSGLFDVFNNCDKDVTFVCGHDHTSNVCLSYDNVKMLYTLGMSYNSYCTRSHRGSEYIANISYVLDNSLCRYIDGVTGYLIDNNQDITISNLYNQYSGVLDNIKTKLYKAMDGLLTYNVKGLTIVLQILLPLSAAGCIAYYVGFGIYLSKYIKEKSKDKKTAK